MKKLLFIVFVLVTSTSCDKNDIENSTLNGVWIETIHKTDTLVFDNQYSGFILNRGTEIRNGYLLPKYLSGPYMYEIKNDSISLRWSASSSSYTNKYSFKLDLKNKEIKVGNFYVDSINTGVVLTFTKVH
ncbi:MAG: hypothetical protein ACOYMD_06375 [Paludibacter sp.]